ncbi:MAG: hypothetical protein JSR24_02630 [Proteobacteria bacterium]|nr:hypothetical protein [Pseudomonadota bacterium]
METPVAWGFLKGFGMIVAGLAITLLLATMLQSRAETRHALAVAANRDQALAARPLVQGVPKETLPRIEFTQELVSGR